MADLTKCPGSRVRHGKRELCPQRATCVRYLAPADPTGQSWAHFWRPDRLAMGIDCYWPARGRG